MLDNVFWGLIHATFREPKNLSDRGQLLRMHRSHFCSHPVRWFLSLNCPCKWHSKQVAILQRVCLVPRVNNEKRNRAICFYLHSKNQGENLKKAPANATKNQSRRISFVALMRPTKFRQEIRPTYQEVMTFLYLVWLLQDLSQFWELRLGAFYLTFCAFTTQVWQCSMLQHHWELNSSIFALFSGRDSIFPNQIQRSTKIDFDWIEL